jgi:hypothetical protein
MAPGTQTARVEDTGDSQSDQNHRPQFENIPDKEVAKVFKQKQNSNQQNNDAPDCMAVRSAMPGIYPAARVPAHSSGAPFFSPIFMVIVGIFHCFALLDAILIRQKRPFIQKSATGHSAPANDKILPLAHVRPERMRNFLRGIGSKVLNPFG